MKTQTAATVVLAGVFLCPTSARADKIVLKNGRQIVAFHVVEDGDKIRYETTAGELSIPKSIVDHIERGGLLPVMESPATLLTTVWPARALSSFALNGYDPTPMPAVLSANCIVVP